MTRRLATQVKNKFLSQVPIKIKVCDNMNNLRLRLIYLEAVRRLHDAETLSLAMGFAEDSDSPYLLRLLGLELLIKFVFESVLNKPAHGHAYEKLFDELPRELQDRILLLAGERIGPSDLGNSHKMVFKEWGANFVALRYPWEKYTNPSEEQYFEIGKKWIDEGAPLPDAVFRYHPEELYGVLEALRRVAAELANPLLQRTSSGSS